MATMKIKINGIWTEIPILTGKSAYASAVSGGYVGDETSFNIMLYSTPTHVANTSIHIQSGTTVNGHQLNGGSFSITSNEVGSYTSGQTDSLLSLRVSTGTTINNQPLSSNISITPSTLGVYTSGQTDTLLSQRVSTGTTINGHLLSGNVVVTSTDLGVYTSGQTDTLLLNKVDKNTSIVGGTYTKISFDTKGLVTSGQTATQDDIVNGTNYKQYSNDEQTKLSGITSGAQVNVIEIIKYDGVVQTISGKTVSLVTNVITDNTLNGYGTIGSPLSVSMSDSIVEETFLTNGILSGFTLSQTPVSRASITTTLNGITRGVVSLVDNTFYLDFVPLSGDTLYVKYFKNVNVIQDVSNKLDKNIAIPSGTYTKITYDINGLVTSGQTATTNDITSSTDKRYVTDAQLTVIGNTYNTNTGDEIIIAPSGTTIPTSNVPDIFILESSSPSDFFYTQSQVDDLFQLKDYRTLPTGTTIDSSLITFYDTINNLLKSTTMSDLTTYLNGYYLRGVATQSNDTNHSGTLTIAPNTVKIFTTQFVSGDSIVLQATAPTDTNYLRECMFTFSYGGTLPTSMSLTPPGGCTYDYMDQTAPTWAINKTYTYCVTWISTTNAQIRYDIKQ